MVQLNPIKIFLDGFNWTGSTGRLVFFVTMAVFFAMMALPLVVDIPRAVEIPYWLTFGVLSISTSGHLYRRINDLTWPKWLWFLSILPLVGIVMMVLMFVLPGSDKPTSDKAFMRRFAFILTCFAALIYASRAFWEPFYIPSGSMKPTLLVGDYAIVSKLNTNLERGGVYVFEHESHGAKAAWVKRLIGLPGDTIQMQDGHLILNGDLVPTQDAGVFSERYERQGPAGGLPACMAPRPGPGEECLKELKIETLPEFGPHHTLNIGNGALDTTVEFSVPDGKLFFMGDNRDNSNDSRIPQDRAGIGFIPETAIVGRLNRVIFSSQGTMISAFWSWRANRYFVRIDDIAEHP